MERIRKESELLKLIEENSTDDNLMTITHIAAYAKLSKERAAKNFCGLYVKGKLDITSKRRDKQDLFVTVKKSEYGVKLLKPDLIHQLTGTVEICSKLLKIESIEDFNRLTNQRFKSLTLVQFLENCNSGFDNLKIICRYLMAFFSGENYLTIMELGLNPRELVEISDKINQNAFLPHTQGLIEIRAERAGIYLEGTLSPRLIRLLKNEQIPIVKPEKQKNKGLYYEINWKNIRDCTLYYNQTEKTLFNNILKLANDSPENQEISLSILLYGKPGTGKTEFAYQLAKSIQADIMQLNFSEIQSKWMGDTEKNLRNVFDGYNKKRAESQKPVILLINEADGLMNRRVSIDKSNDAFHNQSQSQVLELLEDFKGIVIATTNLYQNIDEAFHRRFMFRQEVGMPDKYTRELILNNSTIAEYITNELRCKIIESKWSPAMLHNLETKIKLLSTIQKIDESMVESLLVQDNFLKEGRSIGFIPKK